MPVELLLPFLSSEHNMSCIFHNYNVASVPVISKLHLVFALQLNETHKSPKYMMHQTALVTAAMSFLRLR